MICVLMCAKEPRPFSKSQMACQVAKSPYMACSSVARLIRSTIGCIATAKAGYKALRSDQAAGVSPLFPPKHPDKESARHAILSTLRREPSRFGYLRSRWTLTTLLRVLDWLNLSTPAGLWRLLDRLDISYKRARSYVHSPDPHYEDKVSLIQTSLLRAWYAPEQYVFLYLDEFTYYRQPTLARAYEMKGHVQPLAHYSYRTNTRCRLLAAMNAISGEVFWQQGSKVGIRQLTDFYDTLRAAYPEAKQIYVAQDNWPVHFHPDVLAHLQPQRLPWQVKVPWNWPTEPSPKAVKANLPIQILCLPSYASWLNPIEKLWRWLKQAVLHLHRLSEEWDALKQQVADFLNQFQNGSQDLLHYVGLLPS